MIRHRSQILTSFPYMKLRFLYRAWKARFREQRVEIEVARALIRPGDLVVDAGANKGAYLYWLRQFVGPTGTVLAYEPQPQLANYLQGACTAFRWTNVEIHSIALSDRAGKSTLHIPGGGISPGASLEGSVLENAKGSTSECLVDTLDHQLAGRPTPSFLKIDVEGHELALFEGAAETLRRHKPALLFECERRHLSRHAMQDVFAYLAKNFDYTGFLLHHRSLLPIAKFNADLHQSNRGDRFWDSPDYFNNFLFSAAPLPETLQNRISA
jgi:FkbM family methyltransferase